jgi:hypothetical protein
LGFLWFAFLDTEWVNSTTQLDDDGLDGDCTDQEKDLSFDHHEITGHVLLG